jgi:hypothetical protein
MKKNSFKIRTVLVGLLATLATVSFSVPAMANKTKSVSLAPITQPAIKFLGTENNNSFFSVSIANDTPVKFALSIQDADGETIYSGTYEASKFSKVFKLVNEGAVGNQAGLTFYIQELPNGVTHKFEVITETEFVKEVEITKI